MKTPPATASVSTKHMVVRRETSSGSAVKSGCSYNFKERMAMDEAERGCRVEVGSVRWRADPLSE